MEQSRAWVEVLRENIGEVLVGKEETIDLVLTTLVTQVTAAVEYRFDVEGRQK